MNELGVFSLGDLVYQLIILLISIGQHTVFCSQFEKIFLDGIRGAQMAP